MSNLKNKVKEPLARITGELPGDNLLSQLKADMIKQEVFRAMFGAQGERIFIGVPPSYNETIFPLIEFWPNRDSFRTDDTYLEGSINGRIILPSRIDTSADVSFQRRLGLAFQRFLGSSKHDHFKEVAGLIEVGKDSDWMWDREFRGDDVSAPAIDFILPFKIDMHLFEQMRPEIDLEGDLDAALIGWAESYGIRVTDDNTNEVIHEVRLYETGQSNP